MRDFGGGVGAGQDARREPVGAPRQSRSAKDVLALLARETPARVLAAAAGIDQVRILGSSTCRAAFDAALAVRDAGAAAGTILDVQLVLDWFADPEADDLDWAQSVLRRLVVRLGDLAAGPRPGRRHLGARDAVRERPAEVGIEVHDHPGGTSWTLAAPRTP